MEKSNWNPNTFLYVWFIVSGFSYPSKISSTISNSLRSKFSSLATVITLRILLRPSWVQVHYFHCYHTSHKASTTFPFPQVKLLFWFQVVVGISIFLPLEYNCELHYLNLVLCFIYTWNIERIKFTVRSSGTIYHFCSGWQGELSFGNFLEKQKLFFIWFINSVNNLVTPSLHPNAMTIIISKISFLTLHTWAYHFGTSKYFAQEYKIYWRHPKKQKTPVH